MMMMMMMFRIFHIMKLTKWCPFATYLWYDRAIHISTGQ